jgi:hypothetical protein
VVDDFSDSNLDGRYEFDSRGATTSVATVSNAVTSGADTNVLQMEGDGNTRMHAYKGDSDADLNAYPEIGDTFSCWLRGLNGTENMNFMYGAKDANNKYYVKANLETGDLGLFKYVNGSGQSLEGDWSNSTVQSNTGWFKLEIDWSTDHIHTVTLYQNGSQVTSFSYTEGSSDPQFAATGVGYSVYLGSGETAQFDYTTTSGGSSSSYSPNYTIVENFEPPKSLSENYSFNKGSSHSSIVKDDTAAYSGSNSLGPSYSGVGTLEHTGGDVEMFSLPGDGLDGYPSAGDTFSCWVLSEEGQGDTYLAYGVQDSLQDFYWANIDFTNQKIHLFKRVDGKAVYIGGTPEIPISSDTWYYLDVHWGADGTHEIYLYDVNENVVGEFTETDTEFTSGGIGFISYPASSSEKFYWDYFINGKRGQNSVGGWGPEELVSGGRYDVADEGFAGLPGDPTEDYRFFMSNSGYQPDEQHIRFTIGAVGKNFYNDDPENSTPAKSSITPFFHITDANLEVEVTKANGDTIQNSSEIVGDDQDLLVRPSNLTHVMFADSNSAWNDWEDEYWGTETSSKRIKEEAVDAGNIDPDLSRPGFFDTLGLGWGALTLIYSPIGATYVSATLLSVSGLKWIKGMVQETDCGADYDRPNNLASTITGSYNFCDGVPLAGYVASFDIDYSDVPEGQDLRLKITQDFVRSGDTYDEAKATAVWTADIPANQDQPYIDNLNKNLK